MQRPLDVPIGAPIEAIDTPSLIVDLELLEAAIAQAGAAARSAGKHWRAAAYVHKTPAIAAAQCAEPACRGITVRSISEAEVFAAGGCADILVTRPMVNSATLARAEALAARIELRTSPPDDELAEARSTLDGAVTMSARVASCPEPGRAITDCGQKAIGNDYDRPRILGRDSLRAVAGSAEHGMILAPKDDPSALPYAIGDWLRLIPGDLSTTFGLHDFVFATRDGILAAVWPISARGAYT